MIICMQPRGMTAVRNCNHLHLGLNGYHFSYDIFGQHIRQKSVKQHKNKNLVVARKNGLVYVKNSIHFLNIKLEGWQERSAVSPFYRKFIQ